jgi:hypothetical protein
MKGMEGMSRLQPRNFLFIYFISLSINPVESIQSLADVEIVLVTVTIKNTVSHPIGYIFVIQIL